MGNEKTFTDDDKIDTLAILPFINASGEKETEYLSDGIPESIISNMQKIPNLRVASFSSVLYRYKDKVNDPVVVGSEMNVESVAMGRLTLQGDNVSINIEIIDTRDNSIILAKQYIEKLANLFEIQTKIAGDITDHLRLELTGQERKVIAPKQQVNAEAYQNYLKGRHFWYKRNPEDFKKAIAYFKAAIDLDPTYALAYSGLADTYTLQGQYSGTPMYRIIPPARKAAEKAMANLNLMGNLVSQDDFYSGPFGNQVTAVRRVATLFGADPQQVADAETFNKIAKDSALQVMGGSLGVGFSNADRDFVEAMVPNIENTKEGNIKIIEVQTKIQNRKIELARLAEQYAAENGTLKGFRSFITDWREQNPLFSAAEKVALDPSATSKSTGLSEEAMSFIK